MCSASAATSGITLFDACTFTRPQQDTFKQQGLNLLIAEELAGHSPEGSQTQVTYTKGYKLEIKNVELQKLKYDNVPFNQIRSWIKSI